MPRPRKSEGRFDGLGVAARRAELSGQVDAAALDRVAELLSAEGGESSIDWRITGSADAGGRPALEVSLSGAVPLTCQRCLRPFRWPVEQTTLLLLARDERELERLDGEDHEHAVAQLRALSGRTVVFHTGVALLDAATGRCQAAMVDVRSTFRRLAPAEIEDYLRRDQPYDCAASVKSDALGIVLFERIDSDDPSALVGLPLIRLTDMLRAAGVAVLARGPAGAR